MKKKKIILTGAAVAAVVVIGIGAWTLFGRTSSDGSTENVVYVNSVDNLMNPGSGNGAVNRFAGVVETQKQVDIQQSQDKTVKDIYVEVGQEVSKGDPLFSYDTEKSQEDLEKAKLELERIDNNIGNKQNEIAALEKEKKSAGNDAQLDYTMQIQSAQMELKQSEYEKKSKQVEIQKLQDSIENCQVTSEIDGVVKSINNGNQDSNSYSGDSQAFMSIIAMGDFRIKCKVNEQNIASVTPGLTQSSSSCALEKLLRLSIGTPLSLSLVSGRSITFTVCICPLFVKRQILSVFIQVNTYLYSP